MTEQKKLIRRNKEASIARIINAAAEVFTKNGYENATYMEIAKLAGLNISLINRYFGTKENLLKATVSVMTSQIHLSFEKMKIKDTLLEEMYSIADALISTMLTYENETKAIASIASSNKDFRHEIHKIKGANEEVKKRLQVFFDKGEIHKSHDLRYLSETFLGIVNSFTFFHRFMFKAQEEKVRSQVYYIIESFSKGLLCKNGGKNSDEYKCIS